MAVSGRPLIYAGLSPLTLFGTDDRVRVTPTTDDPWRTVAKIYTTHPSGDRAACSGAMLDLFHVLTAGHCAYLHDEHGWDYDSWASEIEVIPAMDDGIGPYGSAAATLMRTYQAWIDNRDVRHDWAVLTLDRCIGSQTGWMGRKWADPSSSTYTGTLHTAGYPGDLDNARNMYRTSANGRTADEYLHWFYLDVSPGQSGSPVWEDDGTNQWILSIVTYADDGTGSNLGTRINEDKFNRIDAWLAADAPSSPCNVPELAASGSTGAGFSPGILAGTGASLETWITVSNEGPADSDPFQVAFYLSADTTIASGDRLLGTVFVPTLVSGSATEVRWTGTLPSGVSDGTYWVGWILDSSSAVSEIDESNNVGYIASGTLTVDATPPSGTVVINGGVPWTNNPIVTLALESSDATSGVLEVRYSNDGTFDTEPWEAPSSAKTWALSSGDSAKQVWYEVRDRAGHVSTMSASIGLDTAPPVTTPQLLGDRTGSGTFASEVTGSFIAADAGSGVASIRFRVDGGIWLEYDEPFTIRGDGPHRVESYGVDGAGNEESVITSDFAIATSPWNRLAGTGMIWPVLLALLVAGAIVTILVYRRGNRRRVPPPPPDFIEEPQRTLPPPPPPDDWP